MQKNKRKRKLSNKRCDLTSCNNFCKEKRSQFCSQECYLKDYYIKKEIKELENNIENLHEDKGLKIFLNGVSGKLSDKWSKMYSPGHTIQMNLTGQLSILMFAEMLECNGFEVVSANTDGVVVYYNEDEEGT